MAKPSPATIKAYAVAATIGSILKSHQNGEPKLIALQLQINRAMQVFSRKVGLKFYYDISDQIAEAWGEVSSKHANIILETEVPKFIEYLCLLIPPKNFKQFLAVQPYRTSTEIRPEMNLAIAKSILVLDEKLNQIAGTKPYTLVKPKEKIIKQKKEKPKSKKRSKQTSKLTSKQRKERQRHHNAKSFLKQRIEAARAKEREINE